MLLAAGEYSTRAGPSTHSNLDPTATNREVRIKVVGGGLWFGGDAAWWRLWVETEMGGGGRGPKKEGEKEMEGR